MGHNSPEYLHTLTEAMKLAYADWHTYYANSKIVVVPAEGFGPRSMRPNAQS